MSSHEHDVVDALRHASRRIAAVQGGDLDGTLSEIVGAAVGIVGPADAAGVSLAEGGRITSRGPSADSIGVLERLQAQWREGPCVTVVDEAPDDGAVLADDLAGGDAGRWPRFAREAVTAGYRSVLSVELVADGGGLRGTLNLYARRPHVFDVEAASRMLAASARDAGTTVVDTAQWMRGQARQRHAESVALPDRDPHETADERDQIDAERAAWGHGTDGA